MIEGVSNLDMGFVDVAAGVDTGRPVLTVNPDLVAIFEAEQFIIFRVDEADTSGGLGDIVIEPVPAVAVDIEVVVVLPGIEPDQVGVELGIYPETKILALTVIFALRVVMTELFQRLKILEEAAEALIGAHGVDEAVKLRLEVIALQVRAMVFPGRIEAVSVPAHIAPQVADAAGLTIQLLALLEGVEPLLRLQHFYLKVHHRASLSLFFSALRASKAVFAHSGSLSGSVTPSISRRSKRPFSPS